MSTGPRNFFDPTVIEKNTAIRFSRLGGTCRGGTKTVTSLVGKHYLILLYFILTYLLDTFLNLDGLPTRSGAAPLTPTVIHLFLHKFSKIKIRFLNQKASQIHLEHCQWLILFNYCSLGLFKI